MAAMLTLANAAAGQTAVRISHSGDCPDMEHMRNALTTEAITVDGKAWLTAQVVSADGDAYLWLQHDHVLLASRKISSSDCVALAETFALIIANAARDWTAAQETKSEPASKEQPVAESRSIESPALGGELPDALLLPGPSSATQASASTRMTSDSVFLGTALGIVLANTNSRRAFVKLDAYFCSPWCLGVALRATERSMVEQISDQQFSVAAKIGHQWNRPTRLRASVGVAWLLSNLTSTAFENETRSYTALVATASALVPITQSFGIEAELSGFAVPQRDRFFLSGEQVASSPRFQLLTSFGFVFSTNQ